MTTDHTYWQRKLENAAACGDISGIDAALQHDVNLSHAEGRALNLVQNAAIRDDATCALHLLENGAPYSWDDYMFLQKHYPENTCCLREINHFFKSKQKEEIADHEKIMQKIQQDNNTHTRRAQRHHLRTYLKKQP